MADLISGAGDLPGVDTGAWRRRRRRNTVMTIVVPILTFVVIVVAWGGLVALFNTPIYLVPSPGDVIPALMNNAGDLWANSIVTLIEIGAGFGLTVVFAIPMGLAIALSITTKQIAYPVLVFVQLIPKIAIAPLFVVWFGFGIESKVFLVAIMTFFPLLLASIAGFQTLDDRLLYLTKSMGATRTQTFWKMRLPSALPVIFSGLKTAATIAATAAIVAEFVGANAGLGYRLLVASLYLDTPLIFAILLVLTIIGLGLNYIIEAIEYLVMPWKRATN